jgi:hypothetical protein
MKLHKETVNALLKILDELRAGHGSPVDDIASALTKSGIGWDIALEACKTRTPERFFVFFDNYRNSDFEECKAICDVTDTNLLASILSHEGRQLEHWSMGYGPEVYPFFMAGIESLLARCDR